MDGRELVDRDVEEALDLALVEVHGEQPVGARDADHVGDEAGRDGHSRLVLLVGAAVRVVRHDRRDAPGAGALEGVDHDEQLHDRLLDRPAGGLDEEDVLLADVVDDAHEDVLVGELEHLGRAQLRAQVARDAVGQQRVGVAAVEAQRLAGPPALQLAEGVHRGVPVPLGHVCAAPSCRGPPRRGPAVAILLDPALFRQALAEDGDAGHTVAVR